MSRVQNIEILLGLDKLTLIRYPDWADSVLVLTTILTNLGELQVAKRRQNVIGVWFSVAPGLAEYFYEKVPLRYRNVVLNKLNTLVNDYVERQEFEQYKGMDITDASLTELNIVLRRQQERLQATGRRPILEEAFARLGIPTLEREKATPWVLST